MSPRRDVPFDSVDDSAIRWSPFSEEQPDAVDVLALNELETVQYAIELQRDNRVLRTMVHTLTAIAHRLITERDQYRDRLRTWHRATHLPHARGDR